MQLVAEQVVVGHEGPESEVNVAGIGIDFDLIRANERDL